MGAGGLLSLGRHCARGARRLARPRQVGDKPAADGFAQRHEQMERTFAASVMEQIGEHTPMGLNVL